VQWLQTSNAGSITLQAAALSASMSAPLPPAAVSASDATASSVSVTWSASTGATSYSVYRSTAAGTLGSSIGTTSATSFTDSTAVVGTVYYYAVTATGTGGTSAPGSIKGSRQQIDKWRRHRDGKLSKSMME
jgi:cellulose 1,4-beta-cellobiosidase